MSNAARSEVARLIAAESQTAEPSAETADVVWGRLQGRLDGSVPEGPDWLERGEAIAKWRRRGLTLLVLAGVVVGGAVVWAASGSVPASDRLEPVEVASAELPMRGAKPRVSAPALAPPLVPEEEPAAEAAAAIDAPSENSPEPTRATGEASAAPRAGKRRPSARGEVVPPAEQPEAPKSTIDEELGAIEKARAALKRGDYAAAQRTMDAHPRRFPAGVLGEEAAALAAAAKCARSEDASTNANTRSTFDAAWPGSIHARIVRRHCQSELDELLK